MAVQSLRKSKEHYASDERILGSSDFVSTVLKQANEQYQKNRLLAINIETLIMFVCDHLHIDVSLLLSPVKQRQVARARSLIAHIAFTTLLRLTGVEIARALRLSPSAVSKLAAKGRIDPLREDIEGRLLERQ